MAVAPYVVIDGKRDRSGVVIDLLDSLGHYPHRFRPQHIPEEYRENPDNLVDGSVIDFMTNEKLATIQKPVKGIETEKTTRTVYFNIKGPTMS